MTGPQQATSRERPVRSWLSQQSTLPARLTRFLYDWFSTERHGDYGLAVMRIASGLFILGWLVSNIGVAARIWGPGSAYLEPYRDVLGYHWPLDILRNASSGLFWVWYVLAIILAMMFILGWRTRIVTPLFWVFYTAINAQNTPISDGGNYFIRIMLIYLILVDVSRRWSLDARRRAKKGRTETEAGSVLHNLGLCLVVAQLCLVYFEAGLYKVQGSLWQNGTAIYYPLRSEAYGVFPFLSELLTYSTWGTVLATYFTVIVQIAFPFMLVHRVTRRIALLCILAMHVGIAIAMGLPFFSGIMASADAVLVSGATWLAIVHWAGAVGRRWFSSGRSGPSAPRDVGSHQGDGIDPDQPSAATTPESVGAGRSLRDLAP